MSSTVATPETSTIERRFVDTPKLELTRVTLEITSGPERGRRFVIDEEMAARVFIGRSAIASVRLQDPLVSRRHAALELTDGALRITDLASRDGTFVNGLRIESILATGGEVLRIGNTEIAIHRDAKPSSLALTEIDHFGRVVGQSREMRRLYGLFERVTLSDEPVVITGETGTGKELLAEVIHEMGPRASGPFVVLGAAQSKPDTLGAAFDEAAEGTLLIDELSELDTESQAELLRRLREDDGCTRVVVTTQRDLERDVESGTFREDLYYRIAVLNVELPPLRRRKGDIEILARHFWTTFGGQGPIPKAFLIRATCSEWPGNVRELANAIAMRIAHGAELDIRPLDSRDEGEHAKSLVETVLDADLSFPEARRRVLADFEGRYLERILEKHHGNVTRAAAASGIARRYFYAIRQRTKAR
ncbi:Response regulator of zinc sigma-54-dependent two-component system [Labilithrix luteola]|uniref:Response regulator of zinc sigma-54-dependent two-component system n=1 Tax=Labilithrix luteola TaxID=1391654 RepID=A0A0K1Q128_9BACT|nr:sigma 54-interacting transcriptional regulator [Labilithrix luteola]AKU99488.1 Response regulator of zinc sigma-54-dependent two-component system [Labilithrix luteola]